MTQVLQVELVGTDEAADGDRPSILRGGRVIAAGRVDTTSIDSILAGILRPGMDAAAKAVAIYDFVRQALFHWPAPREGVHPDDHVRGVVYDPIRLLNVYGYGYCFQNRAVLEALWQAAGLRTRGAGLGGHAVAEVHYDGAWHWFDADGQGFCRLEDGTVASLAQIAADVDGLLVNQRQPSDPFFPGRADPRMPYECGAVLTAYLADFDVERPRAYQFYQHADLTVGHRMDCRLLPGMRLERRYTGDGRWQVFHRIQAEEYRLGYADPHRGPREHGGERSYGNGELLYQPDLSDRSDEFIHGVDGRANLAAGPQGVERIDPDRPGSCVFRIDLPWVIAGWRPSCVDDTRSPVGAVVLEAEFERDSACASQLVECSVDDGRSWQRAWLAERLGVQRCRVDLSDLTAGRYGYLLRVTLGGEGNGVSRLRRLGLRTAFQHAPASLPPLTAGTNRMRFVPGEGSEQRIFDLALDDRHAWRGQVALAAGLEWHDGSLRARDEQAVLDLVVAADGDAELVDGWLSLALRRPAGRPVRGDEATVSVATAPGRWLELARYALPEGTTHSVSRLNLRLPAGAGRRKLTLRIVLTGPDAPSIEQLRITSHWRPDGPVGLPVRGIAIEHRWREGDQPRQRVLGLSEAGDYDVDCGHDPVPEALVIAPVRAPGLEWRDDLPPAPLAPAMTGDPLDPLARDELRTVLRLLDHDPEAGIARAVASGEPRLIAAAERVARVRAAQGGHACGS